MKTKTKVLLLTLGAIVLVTATVIGTIAFLTAEDEVVNTFTVGDVQITLDEAKVDEDGKAQPDEDRVHSNEYHLVPGETYDKDPTVTVKAGSEESYVRMIMTVHNASAVQAIIDADATLTDYADLFSGWDETVWAYEGFEADTDANTISFEFRYNGTADGFDADGNEKDEVLAPLFTKLVAPGSMTNAQLKDLYNDGADGNFKITVEGHAIQASTFDNADDAWAAFEFQYAAANS